ncbi:MAG TPA: tetratricopeptide repeat protein [Phycisphaerales bacterium]|nr:tetratricopeptide repeat protein [Phycisphaerales bacterium]
MRRVSLILAGAVLASSPAARSQQEPARPAAVAPQPPAFAADFEAGETAFHEEKWEEAIGAYERALAKGATMRLLHFRLGYALHVTGKHEEALKHHLLGAQIHHPAIRIDALYNAACANALLGRKDEALVWLERAIDAGFKDTGQIAKDTDLDSLRDDERFKKLVEGIGTRPTLREQMDFLVGEWEAPGSTRRISLERPRDGSFVIHSTITTQTNSKWDGMLVPNAQDRRWHWTSADAVGTTLRLVGKAIEPAGVRFEGREVSAAGEGPWVRFTYTPSEGGVSERVEVSENGKAWKSVQAFEYTKREAE